MKNANPFTVMFGKLPPTVISRMEIMSEIMEGFGAEMPLFQTYLISGVRGSGKTVLMTSVASELQKSGDWIVTDLNSSEDLLHDFSERLKDYSSRIPNYFEKGIDISAFVFGIGIGGTATERDDVSTIEHLLEYAKKKGKKVLITIDEVSRNDDMRKFASQFQIFARKNYPVFLIMTGLYENIYDIQNDSSLTFLLRSPKVFLGPLNMRQIAKQYEELLGVGPDQAKEFALMTKGYAFAFQAFGMLYYKYSKELKLDKIIDKLDDMLDEYVYKKIRDSLTNVEQRIMISLPENGPIKTGEMCKAAGLTSESFSRYRDRLIKKGLICSPKHGYVEEALPHFSRIVKDYPG